MTDAYTANKKPAPDIDTGREGTDLHRAGGKGEMRLDLHQRGRYGVSPGSDPHTASGQVIVCHPVSPDAHLVEGEQRSPFAIQPPKLKSGPLLVEEKMARPEYEAAPKGEGVETCIEGVTGISLTLDEWRKALDC